MLLTATNNRPCVSAASSHPYKVQHGQSDRQGELSLNPPAAPPRPAVLQKADAFDVGCIVEFRTFFRMFLDRKTAPP